MALLISIKILFFIPLFHLRIINTNQFYIIRKFIYWILLTTVILLTWIGIKSVETPYILYGQLISILYFLIYLIIPNLEYWFDKIIN